MSATEKPHDVGVPASAATLHRLRTLRTESARAARGLREFEERERRGLAMGQALPDEYRRVWLLAVEGAERCAREAVTLATDCDSIEAATEACGVLSDLILVRSSSSSLAAAMREGDAARARTQP